MFGYTRSLTSRIVPKSACKASSSSHRCAVTHGSRSLASRAVSCHKTTKLNTLARKSYTTNPYLKIVKPAVGPLDSMDMIAQVPPIVVPGTTATCDGGDGPLGHPKIFISLHLSTVHDCAFCEYCGLRFISQNYLDKEIKAGNKLERGVHFLEPADLPDWEYNAHGGGGHH